MKKMYSDEFYKNIYLVGKMCGKVKKISEEDFLENPKYNALRDDLTTQYLKASYNVEKYLIKISEKDFTDHPGNENLRINAITYYAIYVKMLENYIGPNYKIDNFKDLIRKKYSLPENESVSIQQAFKFIYEALKEFEPYYTNNYSDLYNYIISNDRKRFIQKHINLQIKNNLDEYFRYYCLNEKEIEKIINKKNLLNVYNPEFDYERKALFQIINNYDFIYAQIKKLDKYQKDKFISSVAEKFNIENKEEVNHGQIIAFLYETLLRVKALQDSFGVTDFYNEKIPNLLGISMRKREIDEAYGYVKNTADCNSIIYAIQTIKSLDKLKEKFESKQNTTLNEILMLGQINNRVKEINENLGITHMFSQYTLAKYINLSDEEQKNIVKKAVLSYINKCSKRLPLSKEKLSKELEKIIPNFLDLSEEDKKKITDNIKESMFDIATYASEFVDNMDTIDMTLDDIYKLISKRYVETIMLEKVKNNSATERKQYCTQPVIDDETENHRTIRINGNYQRKISSERLEAELREQDKQIARMRESERKFTKKLEEIGTKYVVESLRRTEEQIDKISKDNICKWKNGISQEIKNAHEIEFPKEWDGSLPINEIVEKVKKVFNLVYPIEVFGLDFGECFNNIPITAEQAWEIYMTEDTEEQINIIKEAYASIYAEKHY